MKLWNHYYTPPSIDEAVALLKRYDGKARVVAGGTDLLVETLAEERPPHEALVDITCIPELSSIEAQGEWIAIGAAVTHTQIVQSPLLARYVTCLVESCGVVGGPQVRNVATLGGNVAHAMPAADGTISLVALDAEAEMIHRGERRWLPVLDLFLGPGQSLMDSTRDLLLRFRFRKCAEREATAFKRIMRPQGVALPILGCAVWMRLDESLTHYEAARVCIAPAGPTPQRITEVEAALVGSPAEEDTTEWAAEIAQKALRLRTSKYRATVEYRHEMTAVMLRRALSLAVTRARTGEAIPEGVGA